MDNLPQMTGRLDVKDDAPAVMDVCSAAESERGCVLTGRVQS